jgi:Tfp pilus assembly protein PilZ
MDQANQKRQFVRIDFRADVEIVVEGRSQQARTVNISQGGVFAQTSPVPQLDEKVVLRLNLPGIPETAQIACIVRWSKDPEGVGLQFENLRAIEVWALNKLLKSLHTS